jgi:hypothetical protein
MFDSKKSTKVNLQKNAQDNSVIYENTNFYYEYLRDMKSDGLNDSCDYSTVFMTF